MTSTRIIAWHCTMSYLFGALSVALCTLIAGGMWWHALAVLFAFCLVGAASLGMDAHLRDHIAEKDDDIARLRRQVERNAKTIARKTMEIEQPLLSLGGRESDTSKRRRLRVILGGGDDGQGAA